MADDSVCEDRAGLFEVSSRARVARADVAKAQAIRFAKLASELLFGDSTQSGELLP